MAVDHAADLVVAEEIGERVLRRGVDLVAALAQLGGDPGEAEREVEIRLVGDRELAAGGGAQRVPLEDEAAGARPLGDAKAMRLAPRGAPERDGEVPLVNAAEVETDTVDVGDRRGAGATAGDATDSRRPGHRVHD